MPDGSYIYSFDHRFCRRGKLLSTSDYTSNRGLQLTQNILVHWSSPYKSRFTFVQSLSNPLEFTLKLTRFIILTYRALLSFVHRFVPFPSCELNGTITNKLTRSLDSVLFIYFGRVDTLCYSFGLIPFCINSVFVVGWGITKCHWNQSFHSRSSSRLFVLGVSFWLQYSGCKPLCLYAKCTRKKPKLLLTPWRKSVL